MNHEEYAATWNFWNWTHHAVTEADDALTLRMDILTEWDSYNDENKIQEIYTS